MTVPVMAKPPAVANVSIIVPESFSGRILYPTTPSPFVVVGGNDADQHAREVWDLRMASKVGRLSGRIEAAQGA